MDEMNELQTKERWKKTLALLEELSDDKRRHFALVLGKLAECYIEDSGVKAVVLVDTADRLMTISVGATEMDCAEMLGKANEIMGMVVTEDAPAREMFN